MNCAKCAGDGSGTGGLLGIGGVTLCGICAEEYRQSEHAPEQGGRGVLAWLAAERKAAAVLLGRAGGLKSKTYSGAERKRRRKRLAEARKQRWPKTRGGPRTGGG